MVLENHTSSWIFFSLNIIVFLTCLVSLIWVYFPLGVLGSSTLRPGQLWRSQPLRAQGKRWMSPGQRSKVTTPKPWESQLRVSLFGVNHPPDYYFIHVLSFSYQVLQVLCFRTEVMDSFLSQTHLFQEIFLLSYLNWKIQISPSFEFLQHFISTSSIFIHIFTLYLSSDPLAERSKVSESFHTAHTSYHDALLKVDSKYIVTNWLRQKSNKLTNWFTYSRTLQSSRIFCCDGSGLYLWCLQQ